MNDLPQNYLPNALGTRLLDEWERAGLLAEDGDLPGALQVWLACWEELPDPATPWFEQELDFPIAAVLCRSIAEAYRELREPTQALVFARRLTHLSTNPVDTDPLLVHGMAALDAGEEAEALDAFRAAAAIGGRRAFTGRPDTYWRFLRSRSPGATG